MVDGPLNKMSRVWIMDSVNNDSRGVWCGYVTLQNTDNNKLVRQSQSHRPMFKNFINIIVFIISHKIISQREHFTKYFLDGGNCRAGS